MIKILIYTDNISLWENKISNSLFEPCIKKTKSETKIYNEIFHIIILSQLPLNSRGQCYSCAIVDKQMILEEKTWLTYSARRNLIFTQIGF